MQQQKWNSTTGQRGLYASCALLAASIVGCSNLQAEDTMIDPRGDGSAVQVKVFFEGECPRYVDDALVAMDQGSGKQLQWVAYNLDGKAKTDAQFSVYFDPFTGKTDEGNKSGVVTSKPLGEDIPRNVLFKYTILGTAKNLPADCAPLDPFFRVR